MRKQQLSGTLDEQCEFLYNLAQEKMADGNFTGAAHALKEVAKYKPHDKNVQALLAEAQQRKASQRLLLFSALAGAMLFVAIGTIYQIDNDLVFILLALIGIMVGYGVGNVIESVRRTHSH